MDSLCQCIHFNISQKFLQAGPKTHPAAGNLKFTEFSFPSSCTSSSLPPLLTQDPDGESELHQRKGAYGGDVSADDFQRKMLNDEQKREKMVEDMITMTREWKEQSRIANKIIKKDIDVGSE